ncbi:hypothetical protein SDC9_208193 [bioreactor metagenome]|uniref:Uncharacterized protein n=1 Tax=bioreactor metagenome TaxID=1076179 RepID=A0A645J9W7_9ZZZZ
MVAGSQRNRLQRAALHPMIVHVACDLHRKLLRGGDDPVGNGERVGSLHRRQRAALAQPARIALHQ